MAPGGNAGRQVVAMRPNPHPISVVPVVVVMASRMVVVVVVTAPRPAADINDWRRDIVGVGLIDHWRRSEVDTEIDPRICDRSCAKREGTENKTKHSLFHGQILKVDPFHESPL
jgi:hypothetical protein